jgi:hypothetical protein
MSEMVQFETAYVLDSCAGVNEQGVAKVLVC